MCRRNKILHRSKVHDCTFKYCKVDLLWILKSIDDFCKCTNCSLTLEHADMFMTWLGASLSWLEGYCTVTCVNNDVISLLVYNVCWKLVAFMYFLMFSYVQYVSFYLCGFRLVNVFWLMCFQTLQCTMLSIYLYIYLFYFHHLCFVADFQACFTLFFMNI